MSTWGSRGQFYFLLFTEDSREKGHIQLFPNTKYPKLFSPLILKFKEGFFFFLEPSLSGTATWNHSAPEPRDVSRVWPSWVPEQVESSNTRTRGHASWAPVQVPTVTQHSDLESPLPGYPLL